LPHNEPPVLKFRVSNSHHIRPQFLRARLSMLVSVEAHRT
jgi:hypothetical protein